MATAIVIQAGECRCGRSVEDLLESILFPSSTIAQGYEQYAVTTADGRTVGGVIARQSANTLVLRDSSGAEVRLKEKRGHPELVFGSGRRNKARGGTTPFREVLPIQSTSNANSFAWPFFTVTLNAGCCGLPYFGVSRGRPPSPSPSPAPIVNLVAFALPRQSIVTPYSPSGAPSSAL